MTEVRTSALVPYSVDQMYALVADFERYPEFLPWCGAAELLRREGELVEARLAIDYHGLHKAFTTRNRLIAGERIEMGLLEGPFRSLQGVWLFQPLGEAGSRVSMEMDFEFASRLLTMTVGPIFNRIAGSLVDAFIERARNVYG
ncbi:MAG TPA: type II toxin-antitoxin system RatA family toxin [Gammaproteobacteria bacterium]|nr:type II toxin-antitoxin system RatA family toxin [Gammaproteobacteria bacterium]